MDDEEPESAVLNARLALGGQLDALRREKGWSQQRVGDVIDRGRHLIGRVIRGERGLSLAQWRQLDAHMGAAGELVRAAQAVESAKRDAAQRRARAHSRRCNSRRCSSAMVASANLPGAALGVSPWSPAMSAALDKELEELERVLERLTALLGRREAIALAGRVLAGLSVADLDGDEILRVARAAASPRRVDATTLEHLRRALRSCQAQEEQLGPRYVIETLSAQLRLVRTLLTEAADVWSAPLWEIAAQIAGVLGGTYEDLSDHRAARKCYRYSRLAAHVAAAPACGGFAAEGVTYSCFLTGDVVSALDSAQAALGLGAATSDRRIKALVSGAAAAAHAGIGDYGACMRMYEEAQTYLAEAEADDSSPWYWVSPGMLDSQLIGYLLRLKRPNDALDAADRALAGIDPSDVLRRGFCAVRRGRAILATGDGDAAAQVLAEVASVAQFVPRLADDLLLARAELGRWPGQVSADLDALIEQYRLRAPRGIRSELN